MTIKEIRQALKDGKEVTLKDSRAYKVYVEPAYREHHYAHFSYDAESNTVLQVRCISNYFGSIIDPSELDKLEPIDANLL